MEKNTNHRWLHESGYVNRDQRSLSGVWLYPSLSLSLSNTVSSSYLQVVISSIQALIDSLLSFSLSLFLSLPLSLSLFPLLCLFSFFPLFLKGWIEAMSNTCMPESTYNQERGEEEREELRVSMWPAGAVKDVARPQQVWQLANHSLYGMRVCLSLFLFALSSPLTLFFLHWPGEVAQKLPRVNESLFPPVWFTRFSYYITLIPVKRAEGRAIKERKESTLNPLSLSQFHREDPFSSSNSFPLHLTSRLGLNPFFPLRTRVTRAVCLCVYSSPVLWSFNRICVSVCVLSWRCDDVPRELLACIFNVKRRVNNSCPLPIKRNVCLCIFYVRIWPLSSHCCYIHFNSFGRT